MDPINPINLMDPINPINLMDPINPINPINPMDPISPISPVNPMDPTTPINPMDPTTPTNPTILSELKKPTNPKTINHQAGGYLLVYPRMKQTLKAWPRISPKTQSPTMAKNTPRTLKPAPTGKKRQNYTGTTSLIAWK
jgi:hypothetical protein